MNNTFPKIEIKEVLLYESSGCNELVHIWREGPITSAVETNFLEEYPYSKYKMIS